MVAKRTSIMMIVAFALVLSILTMPLANFVPKAEGAPPEKVIQWSFYVFNAPGPGTELINKRLPEVVTKYTNGRVKLNLLIDVISPAQTLYAVRDKKAEGGIFPPVYYGGEWPLGEITNLPFLYYSYQEYGQVHKEFIRNQFASGYSEKYKCLLLMSCSWGYRGFFTRKPISTLAEFKGKKIRIATSLEAKALEVLGGVGVSLPAAEQYPAIERGIVDGCLLNPAYALGYSVQEVTTHFNLIPFAPCSAYDTIVNKSVFDALPEDLKPSVLKAFNEIEGAYWVAEEKYSVEAIKGLEKGGMKIVHPNMEDVTKNILPLMPPVWDSWVKRCEEKGIPGRDMLDRTKAILYKIRGK